MYKFAIFIIFVIQFCIFVKFFTSRFVCSQHPKISILVLYKYKKFPEHLIWFLQKQVTKFYFADHRMQQEQNRPISVDRAVAALPNAITALNEKIDQ